MVRWYQDLGKDDHYALRVLGKSRGFTAVAVCILALGIGGNATIFSLVEGVLFRQPPHPHPEKLVMIWGKRVNENAMVNPVSPADYLDWKRQSRISRAWRNVCYSPARRATRVDPMEALRHE